MALTKAAPQFETPDADETVSTADARVREALAKQVESAPAEAIVADEVVTDTPKTTTVAVVPTAGVVTASSIMKANPFAAIKNALKVNFDELVQIKVTNGNVINRKTKKPMGPTCVLELISYQDQTVMSPGAKTDDKEALAYLKFSDDGIHVKGTGELLTDWQKKAVEVGYKDAKVVKRLILVGAVVDGGKCPEMVGDLVQIDLAPRSMANFNTYQINTAFKVGKGLFPADANPLSVRIIAVPQSGSGNDWTDAEFAPGHVPYAG